MNIEYRLAKEIDVERWSSLRTKLWPHCSVKDHESEVTECLNDDTKECIVAVKDGAVSGFIEISTRSIVDGCETSPVAYIEGWYVDPDYRGSNIGKNLMEKAEEWALENGMTEMGSDSEITNALSIGIHKRLGFKEVGRVVQFCKRLK